MVASARAVANELLDAAAKVGSSVDPLQIQKLLYLAQGWTLGLSGSPLFRDPIEAWEYGPVVPDVYHTVKMFGSSSIRGRLKRFDHTRRQVVTAREPFDALESDVIQAVWDKYGSWSGPKLIGFTHQSGSPWWQARQSREYNARISIDRMKEWFADEAEKASLMNYP